MKKISVVLVSFLFITQCVSLGGTYEKEKVQKIKKIAVVGFSYDAPLETSSHMMSALSGKEKSAGPGLMAGQKNTYSEKETAASKEAYDHLVRNLKKTGWQVKSASDVKNSPSVKAFYSKSVKFGLLPLSQGEARYERDGVPEYVHVASLAGKQQFAKMAKELGVDAVAVAYVRATSSQTVPLISTIHHAATVTFQIFDPAADDLIMLFTSNGKEVEGQTKTKMGKEFEASVQKGALASIDQFAVDLKARIQN